MKLESRKKVQVKSCRFGGKQYFVFASIAPNSTAELESQIAAACQSGIDALEIIINQYDMLPQFCSDLQQCSFGDILISLRLQQTGAVQKIDKTLALQVLVDCAQCGVADIIDLEPADRQLIAKAKQVLTYDTKLMLTLQDYHGVSDTAQIIASAKALEDMGADLVRVLCLAADDVDMLHIAQAARRAKEENRLEVPFCISAIGDAGLMVRLFGERCGNDFGSYPLYRDRDSYAFETLEEYKELRRIYEIDDRYQSCTAR